MACIRAPFDRADGGRILNVTPGGIDSGAEPILDWQGEVVAKVLEAAVGAWKAGKRKTGRSEVCLDVSRRLRAQRRRAGANMVRYRGFRGRQLLAQVFWRLLQHTRINRRLTVVGIT